MPAELCLWEAGTRRRAAGARRWPCAATARGWFPPQRPVREPVVAAFLRVACGREGVASAVER
jgi:hypothetical protein